MSILNDMAMLTGCTIIYRCLSLASPCGSYHQREHTCAMMHVLIVITSDMNIDAVEQEDVNGGVG